MRSLVVLVVLLAGVARAEPAKSEAAPTWADVVGDWNGKLAWHDCAIDGATRAAISVDGSDGVLAVDLTAVGMGLKTLTLLDENGGWAARDGDLVVRLVRSKAALAVTLEVATGCHMTATLARTTTAIPACDALVGWARIEARCTKLVKPPLEVASRLARQRDVWAKASRDDRTKLAAQCEARSAKVAAQLVDVGCAPNPDPEIGMRGAQCQALRQIAGRFSRCTSSPPDLKSLFEQSAADLSAAVQSTGAGDASEAIVDAKCRDLRAQIAQAASHYGCPP
jgi:hypothetical protein